MKKAKNLRWKHIWKLAVICLLLIGSVNVLHTQTLQAKTTVISGTKAKLVSGKTAQLKLPAGYQNCTYTSSNTKVLGVDGGGTIQAKSLGVAKITAASSGRKTEYTITVVPQKKSDVWLSQQIVFADMPFQLKLKSKKYDTSQVKLSFDSCEFETGKIDKKGYSKGFNLKKKDYGSEWGDITYSYGQFSADCTFYVIEPEEVDYNLKPNWIFKYYGPEEIGKKEKVTVSEVADLKKPSLAKLEKMGITIWLDKKVKMTDKFAYPTGKHTLYIKSGNKWYQRKKKLEVYYNYYEPLLSLGIAKSIGPSNKTYVFKNGDVTVDTYAVSDDTYIKPMLSIDGKKVSDYKKKGLTILIDGKMPKDDFTLTAGEHTFAIKEMKDVKPAKFQVKYNVEAAIRNNNTYGWTGEAGTVLQKCADIYKEIINDQMTDEQKVSAIHDYLIYHANYTADGDMSKVTSWHHSIGGLVMDGSGVCSSYALTFYTLANAAGLDCLYEAGHTVGTDAGSHAWNKVKVNGEWYYIDCTWDDPIGGGQENRQYYLSKTLWSDHVMEEDINYLGEYKYNADGWTSLLAGDKNHYSSSDK